MAAAAILNVGKMSITPDWAKICAPDLCGNDFGVFSSRYCLKFLNLSYLSYK